MQENKLTLVLRQLDRAGGLLSSKKRPWLTYLLAFFVPFTLMLVLWTVIGINVFGDRMILAHDQWHQYFPFFVDFRERLQSGQSLLYSWTTGMGTNYLPLYAYYLSSPLNWLALLMPEGAVLFYYSLTVLIKIGCAGLFFLIFLRHALDRIEPAQIFFSTMYALCAFIMGYYWNAIWLDTVALLPLVVLGTLQLLRERKFILYVVSLSLAVLCSYYIGLFVCIFVFLLFLGYNFVCWDDLAGLRSRLWRIAFYTLIALGITAVLTVPALLGLTSTSSASNEFPTEFAVNIADEATFGGVIDALRQVIGNSAALVEPTSMTGLPNIYCGVISVLLALVYCCCKRISWKEKVVCCFLLLLFALSFIIRQLDFVWHGFHFPNMLPYRFSFLFSFVVLYMAYRAYTQLNRFRWYYLLLILPALGVFLYCVISGNGVLPVLVTILLVLLGWAGLALYGKRLISRNVLSLLLCACLLLEGIGSAIMGVKAVGSTDASIYPRQGKDVQALIDEINEREADTAALWRADFTLKQTLNDPTLFSIPGVSVFSSACNSGVSALLASLGVGASVAGNRYVYEQSDPAVNLLLSLKYLIDREGLNTDPTHFTTVADSNGALLLENRDFLPVGWAVNTQVLGYDPSQSGTPFTRIEDFYSKLLGSNLRLYTTRNPSSVSYSGGATGPEELKTSYTFQSDGDEDSRISISFTADSSGKLSIYTKGYNTGNLYLYINDAYQCNYTDKYGQIRYLDGLKAGDVVTVRYRIKDAEKNGVVTVYAASFNETVYRDIYDRLRTQTLHTEQRSDTELAGTILCQNDSLFFTTIPYDGGWHAFVDGEEVRITPVAEAFVAFHLTAGTHEIRLSYDAPGLALGGVISLVSLAAFLLLVLLYLFFRLGRRPMAKIEMEMAGAEKAPASEPLPPPSSMPPLVPLADGKTAVVPSLTELDCTEAPYEDAAPLEDEDSIDDDLLPEDYFDNSPE